ncbi:hypothetical protein GGX14DRAFT_374942, partial [Mycena pura]
VEALYSKTGGKNGKHAAVTSASKIAAISYIGAQIFEPVAQARTFSKMSDRTSPQQVLPFGFIPSHAFLSIIDEAPTAGHGPIGSLMHVVVDDAVYALYRTLSASYTKFKKVMELYAKRKTQEDVDF